MTDEPQMMMAHGEPTRKLTYQRNVGAPAGIGTGSALTLVIGYYLSVYQPDMPLPIATVFAGLIAGGITAVAMYVVGWATRPSSKDTIKVDPATTGDRIEPTPGIPDRD